MRQGIGQRTCCCESLEEAFRLCTGTLDKDEDTGLRPGRMEAIEVIGAALELPASGSNRDT